MASWKFQLRTVEYFTEMFLSVRINFSLVNKFVCQSVLTVDITSSVFTVDG